MELPDFALAIMRQFSPLERQSTYQLMCGTMMINGQQHPSQLQTINEICRNMNISEEDRAASRSLSQSTMESILSNLPDEKKFIVARCISTVALADGGVSPKEEAFAQYYANKLGLNTDYF